MKSSHFRFRKSASYCTYLGILRPYSTSRGATSAHIKATRLKLTMKRLIQPSQKKHTFLRTTLVESPSFPSCWWHLLRILRTPSSKRTTSSFKSTKFVKVVRLGYFRRRNLMNDSKWWAVMAYSSLRSSFFMTPPLKPRSSLPTKPRNRCKQGLKRCQLTRLLILCHFLGSLKRIARARQRKSSNKKQQRKVRMEKVGQLLV